MITIDYYFKGKDVCGVGGYHTIITVHNHILHFYRGTLSVMAIKIILLAL